MNKCDLNNDINQKNVITAQYLEEKYYLELVETNSAIYLIKHYNSVTTKLYDNLACSNC